MLLNWTDGCLTAGVSSVLVEVLIVEVVLGFGVVVVVDVDVDVVVGTVVVLAGLAVVGLLINTVDGLNEFP